MKFSVLVLAVSVEFILFFGKWNLMNSVFPFSILLSLFLIIFALKSFPSSPTVYVADFSCYEPPKHWQFPFSKFLEHAALIGCFSQESIDFMAKVLVSSGLSEQTCLPPPLHSIPPKTHHGDSIKEAQAVLFPAIDDILTRTGLSPQDIDFLILICSGFCPSPSLSSIIVHRYSMRTDIRSYNLSGMGCSAGMLAIDMATDLLRIHKNRNALILSTEILSTGWYSGSKPTKLLLNCYFRTGGAAILLTNKGEFKESAKYRVCCTIRNHRGFDDRAYYAVYREEDDHGKLGVTHERDYPKVVLQMIRSSIAIVGSRILPLSEKLQYGFLVLWKRFVDDSTELYVPNFKTVVQHFCLPSSAIPVIKGIAKGLRLDEADIEPALMTLHRFGHQSSSAQWYALAYMEAKERIKKGDRVWQLGLGSGCKCNSVILECIRPIQFESTRGPWADSIHQYPVKIQTN